MNDIIQPAYGAGTYSAPTGPHEAAQTGAQTKSFLDAIVQARAGGLNAPAAHMGGLAGIAGISADRMAQAAAQIRADGTEAAGTISLEAMLKAKYPNLAYHVFDASSGYWRTRNDYPHYLLYQEGDEAKETLENWRPTGANPFYGSIDGKFIAPREIHALGSVPPGSKAVVIHPKVQERMEQDPEYAKEMMAKIDTWFAFDVARNEAHWPGVTVGMNQAVAIGEDGNICNACSSGTGGRITYSGDDGMVRAYNLRMAKRAEFMRWVVQQQIEDKIQASEQAASMAAKARLAEMMYTKDLLGIFGDEIAGVPTQTVLELTRTQVWGGRAAL